MEGSQFTPVEQPKKANTGKIIAIVVVVLLCCCCLAIAAVFLFMGPAVGNVYSSVNQQLTAMPELPSMPADPSNPSDVPMPALPSNLIPQGGLGDDLLRTNTWGYVVTAAAVSGCAATDASQTAIEVLQEPDSSGAWKEQWTVTCGDGSNKSFDVSFTPSPGGGTDLSVTESK
jgi:hypothetical protein